MTWNEWKKRVMQYDRLTTEALRVDYFVTVARNEGIAESEIHQFVMELIERGIKEEWPALSYSIIIKTGIGFEKRKEVWGLFYQDIMNQKRSSYSSGNGFLSELDMAISIADELWGKESPQYKSAKERYEQVKKQEETKAIKEKAKEKERREKRRLKRAQQKEIVPAEIEIIRPYSRRWKRFIEELEDDLAESGCADDFSITRRILTSMGKVDVDGSIKLFQEEGAHCDCEIIHNLSSN